MILILIILSVITYLWITGSAATKKVKAAETYNRYREVQRDATDFEIKMRKREAAFTMWVKDQYANLVSWSAYMDNIPANRLGYKYSGEYLITFILTDRKIERYITIENGLPHFGTLEGSVCVNTMAKEWLEDRISFFQNALDQSSELSLPRSEFSPEKDVFNAELDFLMNTAKIKISVIS